MRLLFPSLIFSVAALSLCADFPIEEENDLYESEGETHELLIDGDSSFSDDVDLDEPSVTPPEFEEESVKKFHTSQELIVDLKNPTFSQGTLSTEEGGVITGEGIRIQAQKIQYTNKVQQGVRIQTIVAEGDLMMEYANRAFVGSRLEYDFAHKTGSLLDGKTFIDIWFLGGDSIELKEDGSFFISNAFITTSESQENSWDIDAQSIKITKDKLLSAKNIHFRFFRIPFLWLPSFKSNLKAFSDPPIRYKVLWDKGIGPRATMRYRIFSWEDLNLFLRLDYRLKRGFGASVESEYFSPDKKATFVTRSYGAHDKSFPDEKGPHRYRLQGLYHQDSQDDRSQIHLTWDKLSDTRMIGDFKSEDFEINTQKRTVLHLQHQLNSAFFHLTALPRVNRFDSINQQLPLASVGIRPLEIGSSGIISSNHMNAGYLNYVYASDLRHDFHELGLKSSTCSSRLETRNELQRPFSIGHVTLTPQIGILGIFYGNNPYSRSAGQGIFTYGLKGQTRLFRSYEGFLHLSEPYLDFQGLTSPTTPLSHHFYFDLNDGLDKLNQFHIGWRNSLFSHTSSRSLPFLFADVYTNAFLGHRAFLKVCPKSYLSLGWNRPSYQVQSSIAWNNEAKVWDYTNVSTDITVCEDIAFGLEFRHRSKYDWRRADHENFIINIARPGSELLASPLSDGRNTFLTRFFFRLAPKWTFKVQTRTGWGRKAEPTYTTGKVDLITLLTCSWKLRVSYERMPNDNRFSSSLSLVK